MSLVGGILLATLLYFAPQSPWWPQERIVLSLPYEESDPPIYMEPMGETINHPKPQVPLGHPGIDFKWGHAAKVIAAADGKVVSIKQIVDHDIELNNVKIRSGKYAFSYDEIGELAEGIRTGTNLKRGDLVGYIHPKFLQMHWDFGYALPVLEPLCPMTYFNKEAANSLEATWASAGYKARDQFPDICSGDFAERDS